MLQFHLNNFFGTKFKTHGVAIPKEEGIQLVFHEGDEPTRIFEKEMSSILIEWKNFVGVVSKKGMFSTTVTLTVVSAAALGDFAGLEDNSVVLKIHRSNVEDIPSFERAVETYRAGKVDEDVDDFVDDVRDFLHGR